MELPILKSRDEFLLFINNLIGDFHKSKDEWQNTDIPSYLAALVAWVEDSDMQLSDDSRSNFARILFSGSRYE